ncbi:hypothetical protein A5786_14905 [Gordonia sp. 852002-50816_SCH5313054-a]|nr:hypothetical protein A5766_02855 [Gordonia sp. 852002-51296_SCH5728562-b]OBC21121.1 hypothetical protein A5786_14905 [Gordonia sp. 852002-50816_SCH5313054-a]
MPQHESSSRSNWPRVPNARNETVVLVRLIEYGVIGNRSIKVLNDPDCLARIDLTLLVTLDTPEPVRPGMMAFPPNIIQNFVKFIRAEQPSFHWLMIAGWPRRITGLALDLNVARQ